jgi:uncharacterized membrane protein
MTAVLQTVRRLYGAMLTGYFGLLALLTIWNTIVNPARQLPVAVILLLVVTPLLLPLKGMLHGRLRSCAWAAYLSLLYFFHGVTELASEPLGSGTVFDVLEVIFSLLLFFGGSFYIRYAARTVAE